MPVKSSIDKRPPSFRIIIYDTLVAYASSSKYRIGTLTPRKFFPRDYVRSDRPPARSVDRIGRWLLSFSVRAFIVNKNSIAGPASAAYEIYERESLVRAAAAICSNCKFAVSTHGSLVNSKTVLDVLQPPPSPSSGMKNAKCSAARRGRKGTRKVCRNEDSEKLMEERLKDTGARQGREGNDGMSR